MTVLLDTHVFLWAGDPSRGLTGAMAERFNTDSLALSMASIWEMSIKASLGKLRLPKPLPAVIEDGRRAGIAILPIKAAHVFRVMDLPHVHGDPFDRLLAAACLVEEMTLLSVDAVFDSYGVSRVC